MALCPQHEGTPHLGALGNVLRVRHCRAHPACAPVQSPEYDWWLRVSPGWHARGVWLWGVRWLSRGQDRNWRRHAPTTSTLPVRVALTVQPGVGLALCALAAWQAHRNWHLLPATERQHPPAVGGRERQPIACRDRHCVAA